MYRDITSESPWTYRIEGDHAEAAAQEFGPELAKIWASDMDGGERVEAIHALRQNIAQKYGVTVTVRWPVE